MAAASQAVPGEFDSRHLLQKEKTSLMGRFSFWNGLFVATLGLTQSCSLRSGTLTPTYRRSLISSLKSVINAFLNGQLVLLQK